jgi:hypothetical protein
VVERKIHNLQVDSSILSFVNQQMFKLRKKKILFIKTNIILQRITKFFIFEKGKPKLFFIFKL